MKAAREPLRPVTYDEKADADGKARKQAEGAAGGAIARGVTLRDQAFDALRDAAAHDAALAVEIEGAKGTAEDGDALARGLGGLAGVLRGWLKKARKDGGLRGRLTLASLDEAYADELDEVAANVKSAADAARRAPLTPGGDNSGSFPQPAPVWGGSGP